MKPTSKYFDSIRINKSAKAKAPKTAASVPDSDENCCQWNGCDRPATHKAPLGRNREGEYISLCFEHVKEYNKNYNYFSGLDDDSIAKFQKDSITGMRPTWAMGANKWGATGGQTSYDPRDAAAERIKNRGNYAANARAGRLHINRQRKIKTLERRALETLNLPESATAEQIKSRYKLLVKQNHPDANGGDRSSEERLRSIIVAYKQLKQSGFC